MGSARKMFHSAKKDQQNRAAGFFPEASSVVVYRQVAENPIDVYP
jgi:hypothetical protein